MSAAPWRRARGLAERAVAPRGGNLDEIRARAWAETLGGEEILAARLACAGVIRDELPALLADEDSYDEPPDWWDLVTTTLVPDGAPALPSATDEEDADLTRGAARLIAPFARRAYRTLRAHAEGADGAGRALAEALATELVEIAVPTLATELVLAQAVERWEAGDETRRAAEALRSFGRCERARGLLEEYPGLARLIADRTRLAEEAGLELLDRVASDRPRVRDELLDGEDPGPLVSVSQLGDSHDGGRCVANLGFASGAGAVLKPRRMEADAAFQRLLVALSEAGFEPAFRPLRTLCTGREHGWQEFARVAGCDTEVAVDRYFRRLGGQLAALYALRATDMHQENVLACGDHPMLVDVETVLHPRLGGHAAPRVDPLIAETGLDCVLRVGLLPRADAAFGIDMSGLGRDPGVVHASERLAWVGAGAEARLVNEEVHLEAGANVPRLRGAPVDHVEALASGFTDVYQLLVARRERWLAPGGPLAALDSVRLRVILRPTRVYADLLRRQTQDRDGLVDGLAREEALNVLWRGAVRRTELAAAAPAEHDDLWVGDVPKIGGQAGSADGFHHAHGRLHGLLGSHRAPGSHIVRRLAAGDLDRQLAFVRSSVLAGGALTRAAAAGGTPDGLGAGDHGTAARAAGQRLAVLALHEGAEAGWLAPVVQPPAAGRVLRPVDASLRHGQAGIALLLVRLRAVFSDAVAAELVRAALQQLGSGPCLVERDAAERLLLLTTLADLGVVAPATLHAAANAVSATAVADKRPAAATASAFATAARLLGPDARLVAATRAAAADAGAAHGDLVALVAHTAAARAAAGTAQEDAARGALRRAVTAVVDFDQRGPTTRRLDLPVARADAHHVLAAPEPASTRTLTASQREAAFWGGAESPILEDGLAGIGLARLALAGDEPSARALTASMVLRADEDAVPEGSRDAR